MKGAPLKLSPKRVAGDAVAIDKDLLLVAPGVETLSEFPCFILEA